MTVTSTMTWTSGTMAGTGGTTVIVEGATLTISTNGTKHFRQRTLRNEGMLTWLDGTLNSGDGAVLINEVGGTIEFHETARLVKYHGGIATTIENAGTFQKSEGLGTATVEVALNNTGLVEVSSGGLALTNDGTNSGIYRAEGPGTLDITGGTTTLTAGARLEGAGARESPHARYRGPRSRSLRRVWIRPHVSRRHAGFHWRPAAVLGNLRNSARPRLQNRNTDVRSIRWGRPPGCRNGNRWACRRNVGSRHHQPDWSGAKSNNGGAAAFRSLTRLSPSTGVALPRRGRRPDHPTRSAR